MLRDVVIVETRAFTADLAATQREALGKIVELEYR